jgi:hypothetical protein
MVEVEIKSLAPGCFASASVYGMDSKACQSCVAFAECGEESVKTLQAICAKIDVKDLLDRHEKARRAHSAQRRYGQQESLQSEVSPLPVAQPKPITQKVERTTDVETVKFEVTFEHQEIISKMSNKLAMTLATALCKRNKIDQIKRDLPLGINPLEGATPAFLRIAFAELLAGGFSKTKLKQRLMSELGWGEGSAAPHVSLICVFLASFNITQESDGVFMLHPALVGQNNTSTTQR